MDLEKSSSTYQRFRLLELYICILNAFNIIVLLTCTVGYLLEFLLV